jgi:hypothetical protein
MKYFLQYSAAILIFLVLHTVLIIPKLLSMLWYWESITKYTEDGNNYYEKIACLARSIVHIE